MRIAREHTIPMIRMSDVELTEVKWLWKPYIPFEQQRWEVVAVNDAVDTLKDNNEVAPFKNILNEMQCHSVKAWKTAVTAKEAVKLSGHNTGGNWQAVQHG